MNFEVPELGEGVQEGELIAWKVKVGDVVKMDQPLVEVMTDKATVEIPSPVVGTIKELKAQEGDRIKIGQAILVIDEGAATGTKEAAPVKAEKPSTPEKSASTEKPEKAAASEKNVQQKQEEVTEVPQPAARADSAPAVTHTGNGSEQKAYTGDFQKSFDGGSVPASPYVRSLAAKAGVDLRQVRGSGPKVGESSRVLEEDVLKFIDAQGKGAQTGGSSPSGNRAGGESSAGGGSLQRFEAPKQLQSTKATPTPSKELPKQNFNFEEVVERKPLRGLRRVIAQAMVRSKFTAPHFSYFDEFECSGLMALREEIKKSAESYGIKFSYLPFIVKAVVAALKEFPEVNASLEEKDGNADVLIKKFYHIGIAVATDNGLIVPVIKHADKKSLLQIAQEIQILSEKTRAGKATSEELKGSTFTITSMGNIGGTYATPIINYPEVAILGVYKIQQKPVVKNGQIVVGNTLTLSMSCDHRVVDGAVAGMFCNAVIDRLAHPSETYVGDDMKFDVVVIGGGPGGYVAAIRSAQEGFKTAIVENHKLGGECLNYGCIPSKALISAGHLLDKIAAASVMGINVQGVKVDLAKLIDWKAGIVKSLTGGIAQLLKANGVTQFAGTARFEKVEGSEKFITISGEAAAQISSDRVVIATGSEAVELPFLKVDGQFVLGSKEALDVKQIPRAITVVGGGFIGLEIGTFFSKLGTKVTVVEATDQLLPGTDRECVDVVFKKLKKKGVEILLKTKAKEFKKLGDQAELIVELADGQTKKISGDWILVTVGRKPRAKDLGLDRIGVKTTDRGFISVNDHLETSCAGVYAIGDVIGGPMLAHKASKEGLIAIEHMKNPATTVDIKALPWAIFVDPEIAVVGHSEASAKAAGWNPTIGKCPFTANGRALTTGEAEGFAKLIVDRDTDRILGATLVGPDVSNLIQEVAMAIEMGATANDLALTVHAHPTLPETLMEAAESVHGKAIHFFQRKAPEVRTQP